VFVATGGDEHVDSTLTMIGFSVPCSIAPGSAWTVHRIIMRDSVVAGRESPIGQERPAQKGKETSGSEIRPAQSATRNRP
jgi:hypothetical protein